MKAAKFIILVPIVLLLSGCGNLYDTVDEIQAYRKHMKLAKDEVEIHYSNAHPEVQEYVLWTAGNFYRLRFWRNEGESDLMTDTQRQERVEYLAKLLEEGSYGRHLCNGLAEASTMRHKRLVPGLMRIAGFENGNVNLDCRPKWMACAALARQESPEAVPLLISLVDYGNTNTRMWARAALARLTGQDFGEDKQAWASWWESQGNETVDPKFLEPFDPEVRRNLNES